MGAAEIIGKTVSHFRVLAKIGEGGMGVVYRAEDEKLRRDVALKFLPLDRVGDPERRLRFLREARAAAAVSHPNIATVYEVGETDGIVFIAMEFIEGRTLHARIDGKPLPLEETVRIATEMAEGLAAAHQRRVVHRDFKPGNVIVSTQGRVKILDFGLAKVIGEESESGTLQTSEIETVSAQMTRHGKILGTPAYMSPEQARGQPVDARSDVFAFGITLYEMTTGRVPFRGRTVAESLSATIREEAIPPSTINEEVPPRLEEIVHRCLEKDARDRYQDTRELAADLRKVQQETASGVPLVRRHPARRVAAIASLALVLAASGYGAWWVLRSPGEFKKGDRVLVASFENRTGRPDLDTAVRDAFEDQLTESTFLRVISADSLKELEPAGGGGATGEGANPVVGGPTVVSRDQAERLCRGADCAGFLAGSVTSEGAGFRLEADLYRSGGRRPLVARQAVAASDADLVAVIHNLSLELRRAVGEEPDSVMLSMLPATRSLVAYHALIRAQQAGTSDERLSMFKRVVEIDPGYVDAYADIAWMYRELGDWKSYRKAAEEAYKRSSGLPERVRLWRESMFLDASYDFDAELERTKTFHNLYPADPGGAWRLGLLYLNIYQDLTAAEAMFRTSFKIEPTNGFGGLCVTLACEGKVDELEALALEFRRAGGSERFGEAMLAWAYWVRGDAGKIKELTDRLERDPVSRVDALYARLRWLLASGRLKEAETVAADLWRTAEERRDLETMHQTGLAQAWLEMRRGHLRAFSPEQVEAAENSLLYLRRLVIFSVDAKVVEPLPRLLRTYETAEKGSQARFVRQELQFARGSLALIRGDAVGARGLLEPLVRNSIIDQRHEVLGRTYEALRMWREAAGEYEQVLKNPNHKWWWWLHDIPAVPVLDQFRLAGIYERLGDSTRAREWYERFLKDWKDADPDVPELLQARRRLADLGPRHGSI